MRSLLFLALWAAACHAGPAVAVSGSPTTTDAACARLEALVAEASAQHHLAEAIAQLSAGDATTTWFRGRARYLLALEEAARGDGTAADRGFREAEADFTTARAANPDYTDTSLAWEAMCLGCRGNLAFAAGDLDAAGPLLLAAVRTCPGARRADLGDGDSILRGLLRFGERIMRDFGRTEAFFRAAAEAAPDDVDLVNNAAVYARDHGVRLLAAGCTDEAREMFARSYAAYRRAVDLEPDSVRLRNDCALVAIHHLHDDWETAGRMLRSAIADGEAALAHPPADRAARLEAEEALGDCYENLALWHLEHTHDPAAARAAARRSLELHPGAARPGARRHLAAAGG